MEDELKIYPHRRYNPLTGEWILVSPQRSVRPWQGKIEKEETEKGPEYDPDCYLCPGNSRAGGAQNPDYESTFVFTNDFSALLPSGAEKEIKEDDIFIASPEKGVCRVVCFSPRHNLTLAEMDRGDIEKVVSEWVKEFKSLRKLDYINHILIFENKGEMMGNSNPHPHCQIWAQQNLPVEAQKENLQQRLYSEEKGKCLLCEYVSSEISRDERVIFTNDSFAAVVPFWAVWPFETMILPLRHIKTIDEYIPAEVRDFAGMISQMTACYDRLFNTSFPYSSGIHQSPVDNGEYPYWHLHMHFYPPLLRSATIKKYMVGYELLGNPQRDITPEEAAERLKKMVKQ